MTRLNDTVEFCETDYGAVLLDQANGKYWTLNTTGSLALRVLLRDGDTDRAVDAVVEVYSVDRTTVAADVCELLDQLRAAGLISG